MGEKCLNKNLIFVLHSLHTYCTRGVTGKDFELGSSWISTNSNFYTLFTNSIFMVVIRWVNSTPRIIKPRINISFTVSFIEDFGCVGMPSEENLWQFESSFFFLFFTSTVTTIIGASNTPLINHERDSILQKQDLSGGWDGCISLTGAGNPYPSSGKKKGFKYGSLHHRSDTPTFPITKVLPHISEQVGKVSPLEHLIMFVTLSRGNLILSASWFPPCGNTIEKSRFWLRSVLMRQDKG